MTPLPLRFQAKWGLAVILTVCMGISACSIFRTAANFQKPTVTFQGIRVQNLTFQTADLVFDLAVFNPNSASFNLSKYDYQILVNNTPFAQGENKQKYRLAAEKTTPVSIPIQINISDLLNAYQALSTRDSTAYTAKLGVYFDIPVMKDKKIEVTRTGFLPLVKAPSLDVTSVRLRDLRLTGADMDVMVQLQNPNNFSLTLEKLNYDFLVDEKIWATGVMQDTVPIGVRSRNTFTVPIAVSFLQVGSSVYNLLANNSPLNYRFRGNILFDTSNPTIKQINFPFDTTGKTQAKK